MITSRPQNRLFAPVSLAVHALVLSAATLWAQPAISGSEALRRFEQTFAEVQDFTAAVEADIDMERLRIPRMTATLYFKRPDKFRYTSPGFALFPREGMVLDPSMLRDRYTPHVEGRDTIAGRLAVRLRLDARDPKNHLQRMTVWLDPASWTPLRMQTIPYGSRKLWADFVYEHIQGKYWLPRSVTIQFQLAEEAELAPGALPLPGEPSRPAPRKGSMTVRYVDYKINSGLSDNVFKDPAEEKGSPK